MLTWLHIGDLHVSDEDNYQSIADLHGIVKEANAFLANNVDFAFLPGDNANHGTPEQYARINEVLVSLRIPLYAIPGDHDFEPGSLDAFYGMKGAEPLPYAKTIKGHPLLFLDAVSSGKGGPDFRLGDAQRRWMQEQASTAAEERPIVFVHGYPRDFQDDQTFLTDWLDHIDAAFVDTGHTHYNELLNDGSVLYGATRSTAQNEEGEGRPGYSIVSVDGPHVSWRFKSVGSSWPFVIITSPSDHRLVTDRHAAYQIPDTQVHVRAKVFGQGGASVTARIDKGATVPMHQAIEEPGVWEAQLELSTQEPVYRVQVEVHDGHRSVASDTITVIRHDSREALLNRSSAEPGTDAHAVRPWPEHGYFGTQLGPNKFGVKW